MSLRMRLPITALILGLLLGACGGGGSSSGGAGGDSVADSGGMSGTGVTFGPVNGFGSVIVLGQRFETAGAARIEIDGEPRGEADLAVGMPVTVEWTNGDGDARAERVAFDSVLTGPVTGVDATAGTISAMGLAIRPERGALVVDADGRALELADIAVGDVVQVAGEPLVDGGVRASFLRRLAPAAAGYGGGIEVEGIVGAVAAGELTVGGLTVDFSHADFQRMDPFEPRPGDLIRATADTVAAFAGGRFRARVLETKDRALPVAAGEARAVRLEGRVERVGAGNPRVVFVAGQRVRLPAPDFGLREGDWLAVEGTLRGEGPQRGIVLADRVERRGPAEIEIRDTIAAREDGEALVTRLGLRVRFVASTVLRDDDGDALPVTALQPGQPVTVVAARQGDALVALRVEHEDDDDESCEIVARVGAVLAGEEALLVLAGDSGGGVRVDYAGAEVEGRPVVGDLVEVESREGLDACLAPAAAGNPFDRGLVRADEVEVEADNGDDATDDGPDDDGPGDDPGPDDEGGPGNAGGFDD